MTAPAPSSARVGRSSSATRPAYVPPPAVTHFFAYQQWIAALPVREQGPAWEAFTVAYLRYSRALGITEVWSPADTPTRVLKALGLERRDVGQDFIAETRHGDLWVVQSKYRGSRNTLTWNDVRGAIAAGQHAARVLIVSNVRGIGGHAPAGLLTKVSGAYLQDLAPLGPDFFDAWRQRAAAARPVRVVQPLRPEQVAAIDDTLAAFERGLLRAQIIAACGAGKTRMGLGVVERLDAALTVVFVPSQGLIAQTVREFTTHAEGQLDVVCVTHDKDAGALSAYETPVPVTTSVSALRHQLRRPLGGAARRVVFATYQSAKVFGEAVRTLAAETRTAGADGGALVTPALMICDEAHHIAGHQQKHWQIVLDDAQVPAARRLFLTATQRIVAEHLREEGIGACMSDDSIFGPVAHYISFRDAINLGLLADYRLYVIGVPDDGRSAALIRSRAFVLPDGRTDRPFDAEEVAQAVALQRAISEGVFLKAFTFHSRRDYAERFQRALAATWPATLRRRTGRAVILGTQPLRERHRLLDEAMAHDVSVISSCKALGEGIDLPAIDAVVFADPKESVIDIVQGIGRALRKNPNDANKIATIVIPVPVPVDGDPYAAINKSEAWKTVWNVLLAMAQHDEHLQETILELRRGLGARARSVRGKRAERYLAEHLTISFPNVQVFEHLKTAVRLAVIDKERWAFWYMVDVMTAALAKCDATPLPLGARGPGGVHLASWREQQRERFATGRMPADEAAALDAIPNWFWTEADEDLAYQCVALIAFVRARGGLPTRYDANATAHALGTWLRQVRATAEAGSLSPKVRARLDQVPDWHRPTAKREFLAACKAAQLTRLADLPPRHPDVTNCRVEGPWFRDVLTWCEEQRAKYAAGTLPAVLIERLENTRGWSWDPIADARRREDEAIARRAEEKARAAAERAAAKARETDEMIAQIAACSAQHGRLPTKREAPAVVTWMRRIRTAYAQESVGADVVRRLEAIPAWEWIEGQRAFLRMLALAEPYVAAAYCGWVPKDVVAPTGERIGEWLLGLRARKHNLSPEQYDLVSQLPGWSWVKGETWALRYELTRRFYAANPKGRLSTTTHRVAGEDIGAWAHAQRTAAKSGSLEPRRWELLDAMPGWCWTQLTDSEVERLIEVRTLTDRAAAARTPLFPVTPATDAPRWLALLAAPIANGRLADRLSPAFAQALSALPHWSLVEAWADAEYHMAAFLSKVRQHSTARRAQRREAAKAQEGVRANAPAPAAHDSRPALPSRHALQVLSKAGVELADERNGVAAPQIIVLAANREGQLIRVDLAALETLACDAGVRRSLRDLPAQIIYPLSQTDVAAIRAERERAAAAKAAQQAQAAAAEAARRAQSEADAAARRAQAEIDREAQRIADAARRQATLDQMAEERAERVARRQAEVAQRAAERAAERAAAREARRVAKQATTAHTVGDDDAPRPNTRRKVARGLWEVACAHCLTQFQTRNRYVIYCSTGCGDMARGSDRERQTSRCTEGGWF